MWTQAGRMPFRQWQCHSASQTCVALFRGTPSAGVARRDQELAIAGLVSIPQKSGKALGAVRSRRAALALGSFTTQPVFAERKFSKTSGPSPKYFAPLLKELARPAKLGWARIQKDVYRVINTSIPVWRVQTGERMC